MKEKKYLGYFQLVAATSLAGSSVVVGKFLLHLPIFFVQTLSLFAAVVTIIPIALLKEGKFKLSEISRKDYVLMALEGLFGVLLFRVFMMLALRYASAASTGIALSATPAVLAIFSYIFLKEKIGIKVAFAVFLCFLGVSLLNVDLQNLSFTINKNVILGNAFAFLSVCSEAMFTIFRKKQSYSDKPLTSTAIVMFFAFIIFIPIGGYQYATNHSTLNLVGQDYILMGIYGVACSAIAYAFWFSGLAKVDISEAAGFTGIIPISSVLLTIIFLKEKITAGHMLGMVLVLTGIYIIVLKNKKKDFKGHLTGDLAN